MIEMYRLRMEYPNGSRALNNINLVIERGEFVFIVGPSGAGKSSLLKLIIREIVPTSGTIKVFGRNIARMKNAEVAMLRRNIGVVFQDFRLLKDRSAFDNVKFALQVIGASSKKIRSRVPKVLEQVGLSAKAHVFPDELSGGEQQRLCLARAIVNRPGILLADEPTGNLDPQTSLGIMKILKDINFGGTTVVVATHDKEIVDRFRKRVIYLEKGKICGDRKKGAYVNVI